MIKAAVIPMKSGYIYLLNNPALRPSYHKVGKTEDTVEKRARKLSQATGVPAEFKIVYQHHVLDCHRAEASVKERLKIYRVADTEFFDLPQNEAITIMIEIVEAMQKPEDKAEEHPYAGSFLRQVCELFETSVAARMSADEFKIRICYLTASRYWRESFTLQEFSERTGIPVQRVSEILKASGISTEEEIDERNRKLDEEMFREAEKELRG